MEDVRKLVKATKPFVVACAKIGGLASPTLVREVMTSVLDLDDDFDAPFCENASFERYMLASFVEAEINRLAIDEEKIDLKPSCIQVLKHAASVSKTLLDHFVLIPSLDYDEASDFALGFCMTAWALEPEAQHPLEHLEFLKQYAKARRDDTAVEVIVDAMNELEQSGSNDLSFMLIETDPRTALLFGIALASTFEHQPNTSVDELMGLANMAHVTNHPQSYAWE